MNSIDKPYTLHAAEDPTQDRTPVVVDREACTMADRIMAVRRTVPSGEIWTDG